MTHLSLARTLLRIMFYNIGSTSIIPDVSLTLVDTGKRTGKLLINWVQGSLQRKLSWVL